MRLEDNAPRPQLTPMISQVTPSAHAPACEEGDDALPPSARGTLAQPPRSFRRLGSTLAVATAALLAFFAWRGPMPPNDETQSANWAHHVEATRQAAQGQPLKWVGAGVTGAFLAEVTLSAADRDTVTTQAVRAALAAGKPHEAEAVLARAQQIPDAPTPAPSPPVAVPTPAPALQPAPQAAPAPPPVPVEAPQPKLSEGLRKEILRGDTEFFHLFLYDSCVQDGDVIDIVLNDVVFARVPLTRRGATLSVPVSTSVPTTIKLRGVYDGGGGITVACRTSQGSFFVRVMREGEEQAIGVVRK